CVEQRLLGDVQLDTDLPGGLVEIHVRNGIGRYDDDDRREVRRTRRHETGERTGLRVRLLLFLVLRIAQSGGEPEGVGDGVGGLAEGRVTRGIEIGLDQRAVARLVEELVGRDVLVEVIKAGDPVPRVRGIRQTHFERRLLRELEHVDQETRRVRYEVEVG